MSIALAEKHIAGVDEPRTEAEEAAESYFATALKPLDPELYSMDPAERLEFSRAPSEGITRFDRRSDQELKAVMFDHEDSVERERAAWEYGDRHKAEAVSVIADIAKDDRDRAVRWGALWLLQKIGGNRTLDSLAPFLSDDDIEVRGSELNVAYDPVYFENNPPPGFGVRPLFKVVPGSFQQVVD